MYVIPVRFRDRCAVEHASLLINLNGIYIEMERQQEAFGEFLR
jgi:hypothetical protein